MKSERPVASITGNQEWRWNRSQTVQRSQDGSRAPLSHGQSESGECGRPKQKASPKSKPTDLEAKLERKDRRLQEVIDHYERLLAEKNRRLAKRNQPTQDEQKVTVLSKIVRYLSVR